MAVKVVIGTIKMFDAKNKRGVILPRAVSKADIGESPVYFEAPPGAGFRVGQLVQFVVVGTKTEPVAKEVTVLSESA